MSRYVDADWLIKESMPLSFSVQKWVNEVQIMTAPSIDIQPWISCVEEMPEEFVYVLICLKDGSMYVAQLTDYIDIWGNPKWCTNTKHCLGGAILGSEVIAWKPLPEPWKEADDE